MAGVAAFSLFISSTGSISLLGFVSLDSEYLCYDRQGEQMSTFYYLCFKLKIVNNFFSLVN